MQITIEGDDGYVNITGVPGQPKHYIELSGAYWNLRSSTVNAFDAPVKRWSRIRNPTVNAIILKALEHLLNNVTTQDR